jgi:hypothetical protein
MFNGLFSKSILCFLMLAVLEIGCCVIDSCGCGTAEGSTRYRIKNYELKTYDEAAPLAVTDQSVRVQDLKIILTPAHEFITLARSSFKALYACSPPEPAPTQSILSFTIKSDSDFQLPNSTIQAGENLNSLFFLSNGPYGEGQLESFLKAPTIDASLYDYSLRIFQSIIKEQRHSFSVELVLSDNQKFVFKTLPILLQP